MRCKICNIQESGDVSEPWVVLEGEECVGKELGPKPRKSQKWRCLLVFMTFVQLVNDFLVDKHHLGQEQDVPPGHWGVPFDDLDIVCPQIPNS